MLQLRVQKAGHVPAFRIARRAPSRVRASVRPLAQAASYGPVEELLKWAEKDGMKLSPKVLDLSEGAHYAVGPPLATHPRLTRATWTLQVEIKTLPSGVRGIVATSNLPDGHIVVELPASCTAFSAQARAF